MVKHERRLPVKECFTDTAFCTNYSEIDTLTPNLESMDK